MYILLHVRRPFLKNEKIKKIVLKISFPCIRKIETFYKAIFSFSSIMAYQALA